MSFNVFHSSYTQQNEDDINSLSIFSEYAKAKNYDAAYAPWMELRNRNPKFNSAIYTYGERILKDKIKNSSAEEKVQFINDLVLLWIQKRENFFQKSSSRCYYGQDCTTSIRLQKYLKYIY